MRVGGTRVTLETIVETFDEGAAPEEIVSQYPSLTMADVYAVIAFYLQHGADVGQYLSRRRSEGEETEREVRGHPHLRDVRERLLGRRTP